MGIVNSVTRSNRQVKGLCASDARAFAVPLRQQFHEGRPRCFTASMQP